MNKLKMKNYVDVTYEWLENTFGGKIYMLPRINIPKGIETADYLWNNKYWDLKTMSKNAISKTRAVDNVIKTSRNQSNNFILDITNSGIDRNIILEQVQKIFNTKGREWVNIIMIIDNKKILKIYKRYK